jgi:hypothetical protein
MAEFPFNPTKDDIEQMTPGSRMEVYFKYLCLNSGIVSLKIVEFSAAVGTSWTGDANTGYSQDVEVEGLLATDTPFINIVFSPELAAAKLEAESYAKVSKYISGNDVLTLVCFDFMPNTAFNLSLMCNR